MCPRFARAFDLVAGLSKMPSFFIQLHEGDDDPIEMQTPPEKTAAMVLDACSRKFKRGVGSLSPKDKPSLLIEDNGVVAGGVTYVFTPTAGSQGMHNKCQDMSQAASVLCLHINRAKSELKLPELKLPELGCKVSEHVCMRLVSHACGVRVCTCDMLSVLTCVIARLL